MLHCGDLQSETLTDGDVQDLRALDSLHDPGVKTSKAPAEAASAWAGPAVEAPRPHRMDRWTCSNKWLRDQAIAAAIAEAWLIGVAVRSADEPKFFGDAAEVELEC